jgi:hypothetical protein
MEPAITIPIEVASVTTRWVKQFESSEEISGMSNTPDNPSYMRYCSPWPYRVHI